MYLLLRVITYNIKLNIISIISLNLKNEENSTYNCLFISYIY